MSILIRGMEMPATCCHCPLMGYDPDIEWNDGGRETQGAYVCVLTHELIDNTKREEHCPLVEIQPHGRLGDLDELEKSFREDADAEWNRFATPLNWADAFDDVADIVADAPTIIPASEEVEP